MAAKRTVADLASVRAACRTGRAREIREQAGVSQAEVGAEVGVSHVTVSRWESGKRMPRGNAALRYARLLRRLEGLLAEGVT